MLQNAVVRARIGQADKTEAASVLAAMGLTLSDAFRLMVRRIAVEKALTLSLRWWPNAKTDRRPWKAARPRRVWSMPAGKPSDLFR